MDILTHGEYLDLASTYHAWARERVSNDATAAELALISIAASAAAIARLLGDVTTEHGSIVVKVSNANSEVW